MASDQEAYIAPKPIRASLMAISEGLKRCAYRYSPIYHELWEPQLAIDLALPEELKPVTKSFGGPPVVIYVPAIPAIGDLFRKANHFDLPYPWKQWHEPMGGRYFGCFYGDDGTGSNEFVRLADSAFLVLRYIRPELPDDGFHGWMQVLHQMAFRHPTPLLRSTSMVWRFWECKSDEDHERWVKPEGGGLYPEHPITYTLEHDVVTSSIAAIDLILDDERALPVGRILSPFPISFPGQEAELPQKDVESDQDSSSAHRSESGTRNPVLLFEASGREWHFEFDIGDRIRKRTYLMKGKGFLGFEVARYLLSKPDEWAEWKEIFEETGQTKKLESAYTASRQTEGDEDSTITLKKEQERLTMQFDDTVDPIRQQELLEKIRALREYTIRVERSFPDLNSKFADQIQAQLDRAVSEIAEVLPELGKYLADRLIRKGCRFLYAQDKGLFQVLTSGRR